MQAYSVAGADNLWRTIWNITIHSWNPQGARAMYDVLDEAGLSSDERALAGHACLLRRGRTDCPRRHAGRRNSVRTNPDGA